jgi:hypothetical protein
MSPAVKLLFGFFCVALFVRFILYAAYKTAQQQDKNR